MRFLLAAALTATSGMACLADETEGHVLAYDRKAGIVVLTDKTVWRISDELTLPDDLGRGDRVLIEYETAGEDGLTAIDEITRLAVALPEGTDGGS
jgi:hypothetical protein